MTGNQPGAGPGNRDYWRADDGVMLSAGVSAGAPVAGFGTAGRGPRLLSGGGRRASVVSSISTVVVLAALVAIFLAAPGSKEVRHTFFEIGRSHVRTPVTH